MAFHEGGCSFDGFGLELRNGAEIEQVAGLGLIAAVPPSSR